MIGDNPELRTRLRTAAEAEEREFYARKAGDEWLDALGPVATDADKPFLDIAPWLGVIFGARKGGLQREGPKELLSPRSVGIATGLLIATLHRAWLATLTHTPSPTWFLNAPLDRPRR